MAPAGSYESLRAAINAGCDSVYFGVTQLNMRARSAGAFTIEDLKKIADICHDNNVKAYLTLNTILYDHDMILMKKIVDAVKESHVDSIIMADIAGIQYAREQGVTVHISTQLSVSNLDTIKFWSQYTDVVVLARELDLKMIKYICDEVKKQNITGPSGELIRIEVFAHGAMCVSISGRCGMSLYATNASANRGSCKQMCRRPYTVKDKKDGTEFEIDNEFVMSPQDMCTIQFIDQVMDTGVEVLKLEGRGRSADYVDKVVRCYREAIDAVEDKSYTKEKIEDWMERLGTVYNRGLSDGYYLGKKQGSWSESDNSLATEQKVFLGIVNKYFKQVNVAEIQVQAYELELGDEILFVGATTGVFRMKVEDLRDENENPIKKADRKSIVTVKTEEVVRKNDKVYIIKQKIN
jgi:putative protease